MATGTAAGQPERDNPDGGTWPPTPFPRGCFAWSAKRNSLACVVGYQSAYGISANWRLVFIPPIYPYIQLIDHGDPESTEEVNYTEIEEKQLKTKQIREKMRHPLPEPIVDGATHAELKEHGLLVHWTRQVLSHHVNENASEGFRETTVSRDRIFVRCLGAKNGERTVFLREGKSGANRLQVYALPGERFFAISIYQAQWPIEEYGAGLIDKASACHLYTDAPAGPPQHAP